MRVLVTGGSGVVGESAVTALRARRHTVRLLARHAEKVVGEWPGGVDAHPADIGNPRSLAGCAEGMDAVLHIAGLASDASPETFTKINVEGTAHLLEEAHKAGVRRFVYLSSLGSDRGSSPYHRSKRAAEDRVRRFDREWVIVRPGNVYGPRDSVISALIKMTRASPVVPVVDLGDQEFEPIWHEDLAQALVAALERDDVGGRVLEVSGGEKTSMADIIERLGAIDGREALRVPVPSILVKGAERIAALLGVAFPVDQTKLTMLEEENVLRGDNALPDLIGRAPTKLSKGLRLLLENLPEQAVTAGVGQLQRKRFWADIAGSRLAPRTLRQRFLSELGEILPMETGGATARRKPLAVGDVFTIDLPLRGTVSMRVLEVAPERLTFLTLDGHPLAGAVSFLFQPGPRFEVELHARSGTGLDAVAMALGGNVLQDATWENVVERMAEVAGGRIEGGVQSEKAVLEGAEAGRVERWLEQLVTARKRSVRAKQDRPSRPTRGGASRARRGRRAGTASPRSRTPRRRARAS
jgi:nucleoside-diphosphate-sugar epimerase